MTFANGWLPMTEYQLVIVGSSCCAYSASRSVFEVLPITCSNCACVLCCTTWLMNEGLVTFGPPCCGCATAPAITLAGAEAVGAVPVLAGFTVQAKDVALPRPLASVNF